MINSRFHSDSRTDVAWNSLRAGWILSPPPNFRLHSETPHSSHQSCTWLVYHVTPKRFSHINVKSAGHFAPGLQSPIQNLNISKRIFLSVKPLPRIFLNSRAWASASYHLQWQTVLRVLVKISTLLKGNLLGCKKSQIFSERFYYLLELIKPLETTPWATFREPLKTAPIKIFVQKFQ